jgi:hypothetical protein
VSRLSARRSILWLVLGVSLLFNLTLVLAMPPAFSTDSLNYLAYGRMVAFYHLNPYVAIPSAMVSDPMLTLTFWDIVCPYGPLWVGVSTAVAGVAGYGGLLAGVLLLKGLAGLAHLGLAALLFTLASGEKAPSSGGIPPIAVALGVAWSPLFLLEGAGNGHNDLVMLLLAVGGLLAFRRNRPWLGYILLLLSVLIKYVSALLLLFLLLAWIYRQEKLRARLLLLAKAILLGLATALVAVLPFWHGPQVVLTALLGETTRIRVSLSVLLLRGLERAWAAWPATAPRAEPLAILTTQLVLKGLLVAWVVFQAVALWRRHRGEFGPLLEVWEGTALVYVVFLHGATFPWYFTWPAGTALLNGDRPTQRRLAGLSFGLAALTGLFYGLPVG